MVFAENLENLEYNSEGSSPDCWGAFEFLNRDFELFELWFNLKTKFSK